VNCLQDVSSETEKTSKACAREGDEGVAAVGGQWGGWGWGGRGLVGGGSDRAFGGGGAVVVHWGRGGGTIEKLVKCCSKLYWNSPRVPGVAVHYACGGLWLDDGARAVGDGQGGGLESC
jgi:hypothetical protein